MTKGRFITLTVMVLLAALTRVLPHLPNVTPTVAFAIFGGCYFSSKRQAFIVVVLSMFISDAILGFHTEMWAIYLALGLLIWIGSSLQECIRISTVIFASFLGSCIFYLVTNFGVWATSGLYPRNLTGFISSYIAGIQFFGYSFVGDLFFVGVLFGLFEFMDKKVFLEPVKVSI